MVSSISNAVPTPAAVPVQRPTSAGKSASLPSQSDSGTDTAQISGTAQAMLAAMKEASETPAQTMREAAGGDRQAVNLLARQAASRVGGK
jgi:hypothetical protein